MLLTNVALVKKNHKKKVCNEQIFFFSFLNVLKMLVNVLFCINVFMYLSVKPNNTNNKFRGKSINKIACLISQWNI